jgi:hypothetical protein
VALSEQMARQGTPTPLTDLRRRVNLTRRLILDQLTEFLGPVDLRYDFHREWNGCWRVRVQVSGSAQGSLDFTLLDTPGGGILALPRPLPERWRLNTGIRATDGSCWTLDTGGSLVPFVPKLGD